MITKICNILMMILITILIVIAGLLFVPKVFGYDTFAVVSGSMEPNIHVGSIVYAKETTFDKLEEGDVITFNVGSGTVVTHRINKINDDQTIITKGDANNVVDGTPITIDNVIGKVALTIPFLGYLTVYVKTPLGIAIGCAVVFLILLLNFIPEFFSKEKQD